VFLLFLIYHDAITIYRKCIVDNPRATFRSGGPVARQ
jgi:hypothetical protein